MAQTNLNDDQIHSGEVGAVGVASGTTDQRPSSPTVGMIRYNTTESTLEGYDGAWKKFTSFDPGTQTASNSLPTNTDTTTKVKLNLISEYYGTDFTQLPVGTTAQRPSTSDGLMRYNTTTNKFEGWNGSEWFEFGLSAFGVELEYLTIAGGAAGGHLGGGGAGGFRTGTVEPEGGTVVNVVIGAGGAGATQLIGNDGTDSYISGTGFTTVTSAGGGGGGGQGGTNSNAIGNDGGSGGGGGESDAGTNTPGSGNVPATDPSQGNDGGSGWNDGGTRLAGGGGGGAGSVGANAVNNSTGGNGGSGASSDITGTSITYAGGGGGGGYIYGGTGSAGTGGSGGGGNGGRNGLTATSGTVNTGSGGGACGFTSSGNLQGSSGTGGSGIVVLKLLTSKYSGTTTGSPTVSTSGDYTIIKFTVSGTYTT